MNPKANSRWYHAFFRGCLQYQIWLGQVVKFTKNDRSGCAIGDFVEIGQNFRRFLRMLCELSGTVINRSEIGRSLAASEAAVRDYLDLAEGTFLWRSIGSLEKTASKSLVKMPRGYIRDSGLLCHLKGVRNLEQLLTWPGVGSAFEGHIIEEILLGLAAVESISWPAAYYRTRGGAEVDLVLTHPTGVRIPIEIKLGMATKRSDLNSLAAFIEQENCPYGILVNNSEEIRLLTPQILQIPAGCL
jgi:predicted AAA+ superfamily ATPase